MLQSSSVTIFGGTGFLGRHMISRLAQQGCRIRVPTRNRDHALHLILMGPVGQVVPFVMDVRDESAIRDAIRGSDTVINLIGILCEKGRSTFQSMHVELPARLARLAHDEGVKNFIHLSALGASASSASAYARSKAAGEHAIRMFFPSASIVRPSIVFGPEDRFFNKFAHMSSLSPLLPLIGSGLTRFQPVYVGDLSQALLAILSQKEAKGQTYECGGPETYSFRELLSLLLKTMQKKRCFVNIPYSLAKAQATLMELLPEPLLTRDQVELLRTDNVIRNAAAKTLKSLGITPTPLEIILPTYLAA